MVICYYGEIHMNKEIWKDIPEFEGMYQASSFGRIRSLERNCMHRGFNRKIKEKILKQCDDGNGYLMVNLSKNGKIKSYKVHILIANTFLLNNSFGQEVNHKDGNKTNNSLLNLEFTSHKENVLHAYNTGLRDKNNHLKGRYGKYSYKARKITQFDLNGKKINDWDCISDVTRQLNIPQPSIIACCKGKRKTAGKYIWKYFDN